MFVYTFINTHIIVCMHKYNKHVFFTSKMFTLIETYEIERRSLECDYFRFSPAETST